MGESLEEGEVRGVLGRAREGLDLGRLEELGEDEGVWGRGGARDEVGGGAGGGGRLGESEERLRADTVRHATVRHSRYH